MVLKLRDRMLEGPGGVERPYTKEEMIGFARGVDLSLFECGKFREYCDERYARNTVFENEHFELVVICWHAGQASAVHDHGQSFCLYLVANGEFEERLFELGDDGEPKQTGARRWKTGEITVAAGGDIHQIVNDTDHALMTIHIYSPPLKQTSKFFAPVPRTTRA